jgi:Zn-dependent M28 family amino/carboxypeptidase
VEELGVLGSTEYVKLNADEAQTWALMLNLDGGVGPGPHGFSVSGFTEVKSMLDTLSKQMGHPLTLNDRIGTATDAFPFFMAGVPALNFIAKQRDMALGRGYGHTAADTLDKVQEVDLKAAAAVAGRVLLHLANQPEPLAQHRSRDELKQILRDHKLEKSLRAQDKWPFA